MTKHLTIHGHRDNIQMRLGDEGHWTTVDPIVFRIDTTVFRKRLVIPAASRVRNPKPRRLRAQLVKDFLLEKRKSRELIITRIGVDNVFLEALRQDGVSEWRRVLDRIRLYVVGMALWPLHYLL